MPSTAAVRPRRTRASSRGAQSATPPAFVPGAHLLLFGPGYVGEALCAHLSRVECSITRVTRTPADAAELQRAGKRALSLCDAPSVLSALRSATHLLSTVPPRADGEDPVLAAYAAPLSDAAHLRWKGYLSSTSVYGDAGGGVVDETAAPAPVSPAGRARLSAERAWRGVRGADIFRLAGVYGPGRSALHTLRRDGAALGRARAAGDMLVSRVHVDDVVRVLAAAARRAPPSDGDVFNVADDLPAARAQVFDCARRLLDSAGHTLRVRDAAEAPPTARDRFRTSKRVDNRKIKRVLAVSLEFPTYMHGLAHIAVQEGILGGGARSG